MINAFTKFLKRLKINEEIFAFKKERELIRVPLKDILYFESSDHKIILHSTAEQYIFYDKMERLVALLEKQKFLYVHKSFFVNSKHPKLQAINNSECGNRVGSVCSVVY